MQEITIHASHGIHARPASQIVEACKAFDGDVTFKKGHETYNAKSIMSVMRMTLSKGDTLTIEAVGAHSEAFEKDIKILIENIVD